MKTRSFTSVDGYIVKAALVVALGLGGMSCQTGPKEFSQEKKGTWQAKALVRDLKQEKSYIVNLNITARWNDRLRMDVTTATGAHLASFLLRHGSVRYMLVKKKQFFTGPATPRVFEPLVSIPLDPRTFLRVLFERPLKNQNWKCQQDSQGLVKKCKNSKTKLAMVWKNRSGTKRTIEARHPDAKVQMNLHGFKPKITAENPFKLQPPKGFNMYKLND